MNAKRTRTVVLAQRGELLSGGSPLLIIKNEKQDRHPGSRAPVARQCCELKETLGTNLDTNRGLDKVLDEIKHYITPTPSARLCLERGSRSEEAGQVTRAITSASTSIGHLRRERFHERRRQVAVKRLPARPWRLPTFSDDPLLKRLSYSASMGDRCRL